MKLSELFPKNQKVLIGETEYELKYTTRSMLLLDEYYTHEEIESVLNAILTTGMKTKDIINFLQAGLVGCGVNITKDELIDKIEPINFNKYADAIFAGYINSGITSVQMEQLEVISQQLDSKNKKKIKE